MGPITSMCCGTGAANVVAPPIDSVDQDHDKKVDQQRQKQFLSGAKTDDASLFDKASSSNDTATLVALLGSDQPVKGDALIGIHPWGSPPHRVGQLVALQLATRVVASKDSSDVVRYGAPQKLREFLSAGPFITDESGVPLGDFVPTTDEADIDTSIICLHAILDMAESQDTQNLMAHLHFMTILVPLFEKRIDDNQDCAGAILSIISLLITDEKARHQFIDCSGVDRVISPALSPDKLDALGRLEALYIVEDLLRVDVKGPETFRERIDNILEQAAAQHAEGNEDQVIYETMETATGILKMLDNEKSP